MTDAQDASQRSGPLAGLRVVEFASIGPGPHCAMLLSDLGADVLRIDRDGGNGWPNPIVDRGWAVKTVDIRSEEGRTFCLEAISHADILIEGFRPGVMERLGLGPEDCLARNERLIYGRMTGWGQDGPLAQSAGHDINYIAIAGALAAMGIKGQSAAVPLNLVGDFGGGSMFLAFGIMAALWERDRSGKGQVVDAAIVDGVGSLMTMFTGLLPSGAISLDRDQNLLGGAAPSYRSYVCKDGREISLGPLEPKFYAELIERLVSSIRQLGFRCALLVDEENRIVAGLTRWLAAKQLGMEVVPVIRECFVSEDQRIAFIIADNRFAELSEWDDALLKSNLESLFEAGVDIEITGFSLADLDFSLESGANEEEPVEIPALMQWR